MAVLKQTSPTASPTAPTPIPCRIVPSARARMPVASLISMTNAAHPRDRGAETRSSQSGDLAVFGAGPLRGAARFDHQAHQAHQEAETDRLADALSESFVCLVCLVVKKAWVPAFAGMSG